MRQDYVYIAKNTSLCLTTTEKGNAYCATLQDEEVEETTDTLNELLLLVQDAYVLVEDNSDIDGWGLPRLIKSIKRVTIQLILVLQEMSSLMRYQKDTWD